MNAHRKGLYTTIGGVGFSGQGLEIKDAIKPEEKKAQLRGFHDGRGGWHSTLGEAKAKASTWDLLVALLRRQSRT
jgi:hypothetical protein